MLIAQYMLNFGNGILLVYKLLWGDWGPLELAHFISMSLCRRESGCKTIPTLEGR